MSIENGKFEVGDRGRIYGFDSPPEDYEIGNLFDGEVATIREIKGNLITVRIDGQEGQTPAQIHYRQFRRFKKKTPAPKGKPGGLEVWIDVIDVTYFGAAKLLRAMQPKSLGAIKFIEALDQS